MKKKNIIMALVCLFVLILPTTIYAGLCSGHNIEEKTMVAEPRGACIWERVSYEYCTKGCGYKKYTARGNEFTQHFCIGTSERLPDTYTYSNKTATKHTKTRHIRVKCGNYSKCHYISDTGVDPVTEKHSCSRHVNLGPNSTLHYCSCGKEKYAAPGKHW